MIKSGVTLAVAVSFLLASSVARAAQIDQTLTNPGFEVPYVDVASSASKGRITGQLANEWQDNSGWADVDAAYSESQRDSHSGGAAQAISVTRVDSGFCQLVQHVALSSGRRYRAGIWIKGDAGGEATLALRQAGSPWKSYAERTVYPNGTWRHVIVTARVTDTTDGYFMLKIGQPANVAVDDASFEDVTDKVSDAAPLSGNLLPDSSFEAGLGAGWSVTGVFLDPLTATQNANVDMGAQIDNGNAADGFRSIRIPLALGSRSFVYSPVVPVNCGRAYTASISLRSDRPDTTAVLTLLGVNARNTVVLTDKWTRYLVSGVIPYGASTATPYGLVRPIDYGDATRLSVEVRPMGNGNAWFDAAELHEGPGPISTYSQRYPSELTLTCSRPGSVFQDGESAIIGFSTSNIERNAVLRCSITDLYGAAEKLPDTEVTASAISVRPNIIHPRGVFKLTAQLVSATGKPLSPLVDKVFARLPRPRDIEPNKSYFGAHIPITSQYLAIARATGTRWCRIHDATWLTTWPVAEPQQGQFVYYDKPVQDACEAGVAILGMLDGGPAWTSETPRAQHGYFAQYNLPNKPGMLDEWAVYVASIVNHYKGKINAWEVWNEPYGREFKPGDPTFYGQLLRSAAAATRRANPEATVVGVDTARWSDDFTNEAIRTAGSDSYDAFSYHDYYERSYGGPRAQTAIDIAHYNQIQAKYGAVKPIWITECAPSQYAPQLESMYYPLNNEVHAREQMAMGIRFDVTAISSGVKRLFYYTFDKDLPEGPSNWTALEYDHAVRPILAARAVLASLIDGATALGRREPVDGVDSYGFRRADGSQVTVLWAYATSRSVAMPKGVRLLDALGNTISDNASTIIGPEPIYVLSVSKDGVNNQSRGRR